MRYRLYFLPLFLLMLSVGLRAQLATATLSGTVTDPAGANIAQAKVTVQNVATGIKRNTTTNSDGWFTVPLLPPGNYTLTVEQAGFATITNRDVILNIGDQRSLTIQLRVSNVADTVNVQETASSLSESAAVGTVVNREFIANMPLSGRTLQSLFDLTPGVLRSAGIEGGQFVVNGQRADANYFLVDGVGANVNTSALPNAIGLAGQLPTLSALNTTHTMVSLDALQEFKILTSTYAPEFGRTSGGQVSLVTRSGTNQFTGSAYNYWRNEVLEANDWFANRNRIRRPPTRQNNFGGVFGGPVLLPGYDGRNRTFFFASYESLRLQQPQVANTIVPSLATRRNAIPAMQAILNAYPLPTGPDVTVGGVAGAGAAYVTSYSDPTELNSFSLRMDHQLKRAGMLFGRFSNAPSSTISRTLGLSNPRTSERNTRSYTVGHTWTAASLAHEFRANVTETTGFTDSKLDNRAGAVPAADSAWYPAFANSQNAGMTFQVNFGAEIPSLTAGITNDHLTRQLNLVDSLQLERGAHSLKFGVDYRRLNIDFRVNTSISPNFPTIANLLSGLVPALSVTARQPGISPIIQNTSLFAQDTWRMNSRLTLTYGLRWELNPPPREANGKQLTTLVNTDNPAAFDFDTSGRSFYPMRYGNVAPRFGAAYQLARRPNWGTTLRGGAGLYYDLGTTVALQGYEGYPYRITVNYPNVQFPPASAASVVLPAFRTTPPYTTSYGFAPDFVSPRTIQWNVTVEQGLGARQTVSVAYVGAAGRKLTRTESYRLPNPRFGDSLAITRNEGSSDYHSLQFQFQRRLAAGLQASAQYTLSRSEDTASTGATIPNVPVIFAEAAASRAASDFDVRHNFAAAISYDLPRLRSGARVWQALLSGYSIDTLIKGRSATPVNATGRTLTSPFNGALRPNLLPGVPLYLDDPNVPGGRRFNVAAFALPAVGVQGNAPRNLLRGFGARQIDIAMRREIALRERLKLQFRVEFFNVFNTPNFANPSGAITASTFGRATQMLNRGLRGLSPLYEIGGPRSGQLSLKLVF
jgi:hypothetical protein